ncbi:hypothetical protein ACLOJK_022619 [Asimina triloba]
MYEKNSSKVTPPTSSTEQHVHHSINGHRMQTQIPSSTKSGRLAVSTAIHDGGPGNPFRAAASNEFWAARMTKITVARQRTHLCFPSPNLGRTQPQHRSSSSCNILHRRPGMSSVQGRNWAAPLESADSSVHEKTQADAQIVQATHANLSSVFKPSKQPEHQQFNSFGSNSHGPTYTLAWNPHPAGIPELNEVGGLGGKSAHRREQIFNPSKQQCAAADVVSKESSSVTKRDSKRRCGKLSFNEEAYTTGAPSSGAPSSPNEPSWNPPLLMGFKACKSDPSSPAIPKSSNPKQRPMATFRATITPKSDLEPSVASSRTPTSSSIEWPTRSGPASSDGPAIIPNDRAAAGQGRTQQPTAAPFCKAHTDGQQTTVVSHFGRNPLSFLHKSRSPSKSRMPSPNRRSTVQRLNPNHPGHHERITDSRQERAVSHEPAASSQDARPAPSTPSTSIWKLAIESSSNRRANPLQPAPNPDGSKPISPSSSPSNTGDPQI